MCPKIENRSASGIPNRDSDASRYEDALRDNSQSNVPDQVVFDFPAWLEIRSRRDRCIIGDMSMHERLLDVLRKYRISPCQLRRHFKEDWGRF